MSRSLAAITDLPQFRRMAFSLRDRAGLRKPSHSKAREAGLPVGREQVQHLRLLRGREVARQQVGAQDERARRLGAGAGYQAAFADSLMIQESIDEGKVAKAKKLDRYLQTTD